MPDFFRFLVKSSKLSGNSMVAVGSFCFMSCPDMELINAKKILL